MSENKSGVKQVILCYTGFRNSNVSAIAPFRPDNTIKVSKKRDTVTDMWYLFTMRWVCHEIRNQVNPFSRVSLASLHSTSNASPSRSKSLICGQL